MSTPRSRRALPGRRPGPTATLLALLLALVVLGAPAAAAPTPDPDATTAPGSGSGGTSAPEVPRDPLAVTIDDLTPSVLPTTGRLEVAGDVVNRSEGEWRELSVYLVVSGGPIASEEELARAVVSDPRTDVGDRIVEEGLYVELPDLAPGERARYELSVPSTALGTNGQPGVYWLAVHVLGTSDEGRLEGADGRARTFLPFVPAGDPGDGSGGDSGGDSGGGSGRPATELALGLQLREPVQRTGAGRLAQEEQWSRALGEHGALGRLVRLGGTAGDWPLTWVVDPAVVDAAVTLGRGNPPLDLAGPPEPEPDPETPGAPEDGGSEAAGDGAGGETGDEAEPPGDDGNERSVGARRAEEWVGLFSEQAQERPVLQVPYADVDVPGAQAARASGLVATALVTGDAFLDGLDVEATPVVATHDARLAPEALEALEDRVAALLDPEAVEVGESEGAAAGGAGPVVRLEDGRRVVTAETVPGAAGPGPNNRGSALAVRQRLLADAALHALSEDRDQPLVRLLPRSWDPGWRWADADFFAGLDVPWLSGTSLATLVTSAPATDGRLTPLEDAVDGEGGDGDGADAVPQLAATPLPPAGFRAAREVIATGEQLDELLTVNDVFADEVTRLALTTVSRWARGRPWAAAAQAGQMTDRVEGWLDQVSVRSPSFVTMSSESGTFQVSLVNGLDQPVTVGLEVTADGDDLHLAAPTPVEIPAEGRGAMRIDAAARDIGVHQVTLQPVSVDGTPVGEPTTISVRSSRVGLILWVVMAVGGGLLFAAVTVRVVRRIRQRRRTHGPLLARTRAATTRGGR